MLSGIVQYTGAKITCPHCRGKAVAWKQTRGYYIEEEDGTRKVTPQKNSQGLFIYCPWCKKPLHLRNHTAMVCPR